MPGYGYTMGYILLTHTVTQTPHAGVGICRVWIWVWLVGSQVYLCSCLSHTDVQDYEWLKLVVCKATVKIFRLCYAQEEIIHLNIEVWCLQTAIHNEEWETSKAIAALCYDRFFSFCCTLSLLTFSPILVDSSLSPWTSISTNQFSHADYVVPFTFPLPFSFYDDVSLQLGQALLCSCTFSLLI